MSPVYYSYAKLSRNDFGIARLPISGLGLGNLLFPWARFMIATKRYGLRPIFPTWFQIRFGPILRGEKDKRFYHNLFYKSDHQIGGFRKLHLLRMAHRTTEDEFFSGHQGNCSKDVIVVFEGEKGRFRNLNGSNEFLYREIQMMTRARWLSKVNEIAEIPIGIHVRRGDFSKPKTEADFYNTGNLQIPLSWFIDCLKQIRTALGFPVKASVFSDGTDEELKDLLAQKQVVRITTGSAIGDLLGLSKARILIASGGSFSAWASFFGQMPTINHPGQSLSWLNLVNTKGYYLGEFDLNKPPKPFMDQARSVLNGS